MNTRKKASGVLTHGSAVRVRGARTHNLKGLDVDLPHGSLSVICGLSGSGKSSLAFDTIFAEGQRRFVESLSTYARQFLGQMDKPDVDSIEGLAPAIAIDQRSVTSNPRSTVGTVTEIYDHLRVLYARTGVQHCPDCAAEATPYTVEQMVQQGESICADASSAESSRTGTASTTVMNVLAPVVRGRKGTHASVLSRAEGEGYARARIDGAYCRLDEAVELDGHKTHTIEIVVDRVPLSAGRQRLTEAVEAALKLSDGMVSFVTSEAGKDQSPTMTLSSIAACAACERQFSPLEPRSFSFNSPYGACSGCSGIGTRLGVNLDAAVPDRTRSVRDGAVIPLSSGMQRGWNIQLMSEVVRAHGGDPHGPFEDLPSGAVVALIEGVAGTFPFTYRSSRGRVHRMNARFEGVLAHLLRQLDNGSARAGERASAFLNELPCPTCSGSRLSEESAAVRVDGRTMPDLTCTPVSDLMAWASEFYERCSASASEADRKISLPLLEELTARLSFLDSVGLGYLTLARSASTLSGGEAQRIRLATQIGSGLVGVLYVLDEPSIGLHPSDNLKLIETMSDLRDLGNTLVVVEHDRDTLLSSDHIVEIGPAAGENGGQVIFSGHPDSMKSLPAGASLTGDYLCLRRRIPVPAVRRDPSGILRIIGASGNNLKGLDVNIPLGAMTCVTGVSGSGKSTLVSDTLSAALHKLLHGNLTVSPAPHSRLEGAEALVRVVTVDQAPIGRTPRSNPATYTGMFDHIRRLFADTEEARIRGYSPGRFSFNVAEGRCSACRGDGSIKVEMQFLADVHIQCTACEGRRYDAATLDVKYRGLSISDVLDLTVTEATTTFSAVPQISRILKVLDDVGLGYLRLGQPATTLSGGEAQRLKLASELRRRSSADTMYILDEPTTGLHFEDVRKLLEVLHRLVDRGATVVVIEHDLDVAASADWIVDLGPGGGPEGGMMVDCGTPEEISSRRRGPTAEHLAAHLAVDPERATIAPPAQGMSE